MEVEVGVKPECTALQFVPAPSTTLYRGNLPNFLSGLNVYQCPVDMAALQAATAGGRRCRRCGGPPDAVRAGVASRIAPAACIRAAAGLRP